MIDLLFLGDLILDVPEPDHWLAGIAPVTRAATLSIGHLEVPHTHHMHEMVGDVPAPGAEPAHLAALARAGIGLVSLAGNHISDCGAQGIADTIGWAGADTAGANYIVIRAADGGLARPQADLLDADPASLALMARQVSAVRSQADIVIVALHKGITHRPATLAPYERPVAQAAIDAGADVVASHHAHIARGIELYRGKPIFHGLGNGVVVTHALSPAQDHPARAAWAERRKAIFGFEPDPAYALAPFHPEAINGMIGRCRIGSDGTIETGFMPMWFAPPGRPERARSGKAGMIAAYIDRIGQAAGLPPLDRVWADDWVILRQP
jgi:hypothetical protein